MTIILWTFLFATYIVSVYVPYLVLSNYVKALDKYHDARLKRLEEALEAEAIP